MDMNRTFFLKKEARKPNWRVIDAQGMVLGRLATTIANVLRGKDRAYYTPHADAGDYVVVINADKIVLTGNKMKTKIYQRYSGWMGGLKETTAQDLLKKHPTHLVELAVRGMMPKNTLRRQMLKKLKVYAGNEHPHTAQSPEVMKLD
jgi:large subunit ribosomal protein L13